MEETIEIINPFGFIYITTNLINGKKYIGQKMFRKSWKRYLGSGKTLSKAIKKYGRENFYREIIAIAYSKEELDILEIMFIKEHGAVDSNDYYNLAPGGEGKNVGLHPSEETKLKMSLIRKGKPLSEQTKQRISLALQGKKVSEKTRYKLSEIKKGTHQSEEVKQKLREINTGKKASEETKQKISNSLMGNKYMLGKHLSEEWKINIREANKGEKCYMYGIPKSEEIRHKISLTKRKFTQEQIVEIREKYATGKYTQIELAKEYNANRKTISNVVNFKDVYINKEE